MDKLSGFPIVPFQPTGQRADPEHAVRVFIEGHDGIVAKAVGIVRIVTVYCERVAIVSVQAILGAKPHESLAVLHNGGYRVLGKAILCSQSIKMNSVGSCKRVHLWRFGLKRAMRGSGG